MSVLRLFLILCFFTFFSANIFANFYDLSVIEGQSESYADENFKDFGGMVAGIFNSSLTGPKDINYISLGAEVLITFANAKGVTEDHWLGIYSGEYIFGGVNIYGFTPFFRIMTIPWNEEKEKYKIWGGGLGYQWEIFERLKLVPAVTYHHTINWPELSAGSLGFNLHAYLDGSFWIFTFKTFLGLSYAITNFETDATLIDGSKYSYFRNDLLATFGFNVLGFVLSFDTGILDDSDAFTFSLSYSYGF